MRKGRPAFGHGAAPPCLSCMHGDVRTADRASLILKVSPSSELKVRVTRAHRHGLRHPPVVGAENSLESVASVLSRSLGAPYSGARFDRVSSLCGLDKRRSLRRPKPRTPGCVPKRRRARGGAMIGTRGAPEYQLLNSLLARRAKATGDAAA